MRLLAPERLWLLVPIAVLAVTYLVLAKRRRHFAARFTNLELLDSVAPRRSGWRRHAVAAVGAVALLAMVIGLARPTRDERVPRDDAVVMLAIDVSRSMTATDVSPSRMESAVAAARDFVAGVPKGFRIGLVAFDDNARILATPTLEHQVVVDALDRLRPGQGTAAGDAIIASLEAIETVLDPQATADEQDFAATIVLLSDGATTFGTDPMVAADEAAAVGVPVTTIAYGTQDAVIEIDGELVPVPSDPEAMQAIAEATDGRSFEAATASQLRAVYDDIQGRVGFTTEQREVARWFLGAAFTALLLAMTASLVWSARLL